MAVAKKTSKSIPVDSETAEQKEERIHQNAVMETLGDDRVVDDNTFRRSVQARKERAYQDEHANGDSKQHSDSATGALRLEGFPSVAKDDQYLIGTERAEMISDWILEAPALSDVPVTRSRKGKKPRAGTNNYNTAALENSMSDLHVE